MNTKICNKCLKEKELTEFYFRKDIQAYRNECKECNKAAKALRESKPGIKEERARKEKKRRANDDGTINAKLREYRKTEHSKRIQREWGKRNRDKTRIYNSNQRAKRKYKLLAEKSASTSEVKEWFEQQEATCVYCNKDFDKFTLHIDHIIPLSRNGTHTLDNLALACPSCNCSKNNKTPEEFEEFKIKHKELIEAMDKKP